MWNPKGRRGNFPLPQCISRVLGCWPVYTETGRTRDSAGQSSDVVSGDVSDRRLVLKGGDGRAAKKAEEAEVQVEKGGLDETARA